MKTAFRIVLALTLLPVVLALAGLLLSNIAGCSGMEHIEHCEMGGLFSTVAFLIAFFWIGVFVVPAGLMVLAVLGIIMLARRKRDA
ncbi:MAG TPA: hypothetical protein VH105_16095 [Burkholderiales bacterium]|jgi:uncharacterized BrkB/YihY/UPF0761 family membrane protein|nr:hypothetical protein [Burkholderiales bacterium]